MPSNDERKARLQAELAALENEGREEAVNAQVDDLTLADVIGHLVTHSAGYPTQDDREVHSRVVRKHYKTDEYAKDEPEPEPANALTQRDEQAAREANARNFDTATGRTEPEQYAVTGQVQAVPDQRD